MNYIIGAAVGFICLFIVVCAGVMVIDDHTQEWDDGDFLP